jgi:hypothetical protein
MRSYRGFPKFPASQFKKGDWVWFEWQVYTVIACNHTHTQLEGVEYAIPNWQLKISRKAKKISVPNQDCV